MTENRKDRLYWALVARGCRTIAHDADGRPMMFAEIGDARTMAEPDDRIVAVRMHWWRDEDAEARADSQSGPEWGPLWSGVKPPKKGKR